MPNYILLLTLEPEGRRRMMEDSEGVLRAEDHSSVPGVHVLGLYGVLGDYDFVCIVDAPDNESVARFSLELGASAGAHIATLPAVPISRLTIAHPHDLPGRPEETSRRPPREWEEESYGGRGNGETNPQR